MSTMDAIRRIEAERDRLIQDNAELGRQNDELRLVLHRIESWSRAYPLAMFPEPDMKQAAHILQRAGISLDEISASNMRHVIKQVGEIAREGLKIGGG